MSEKPMSFFEWAESVGAQVAGATALEEFDGDLDGLLERASSVASDEELQALGRAVLGAYHAYVCSFIEVTV
jgi:hypothetical protein